MQTVVAPSPVAEPTSPIKPSEALRLGRLTRPRRHVGELFHGEDGACVLGAIATGWGAAPLEDYTPVLALEDLPADCPVPRCDASACGISTKNVMDTIYHLNDWHTWGDDQIVTWLVGLGL